MARERFEHLEVTRFDPVIGPLFGWERMAGHRAFVRYVTEFNMEASTEVFTRMYRWFYDNLAFDKYTLDLDSTLMTRYGEQGNPPGKYRSWFPVPEAQINSRLKISGRFRERNPRGSF